MKYSKMNEDLQQRKKALTTMIQTAKKRLKKAPEGQIRVVRHRKGFQFYLRRETTDINGTYLPVKERKLAVSLIQKRYDSQVVKAAEKQVAVIDRFLKDFKPDILKEKYELLSPARKETVILAELSDQEYMKEWLSYEYVQKEFNEGMPEHYTSNRERVRSKSEVMIADALKQAGIPYRYECPLWQETRTIYPDFTILRIEDREVLYWEHLGMMDDKEYCEHALLRIRQYEANGIYPGINLIITMETSELPITTTVINRTITTYCV